MDYSELQDKLQEASVRQLLEVHSELHLLRLVLDSVVSYCVTLAVVLTMITDTSIFYSFIYTSNHFSVTKFYV